MNSIIVYFFITWAFRHIFNGLFGFFNLPNKTFIATNLLSFLCAAFIIACFNAYPFEKTYDFFVYLKVAMLFLVFPQIVWLSCDHIKSIIFKARETGQGTDEKVTRFINRLCPVFLISTLSGMIMYYIQFGKIGGPNYYTDLYRLGLTHDLSWSPFILQHVSVWAAFYAPFVIVGLYRLMIKRRGGSQKAVVGKKGPPLLQKQKRRKKA